MAADFEHPLSMRALAALRDEETRRKLLKYAIRITSEGRGEDLLQRAIELVCTPDEDEGGKPWDPRRGTFLAHMRIVIYGVGQQGWRSAQARREAPDGGVTAEEGTAFPQTPADEALQEKRQLAEDRRRGTLLRARLSGVALRVFDRRCVEDDESAEDTAKACGCSVQEVYRANETIRRYAARILAEEAEGGDANEDKSAARGAR